MGDQEKPVERKRKVTSFTLDEISVKALIVFADERDIPRSAALSEIMHYLLYGEEAEVNPRLTERALARMREQLVGLPIRDGNWGGSEQ